MNAFKVGDIRFLDLIEEYLLKISMFKWISII